MGYEINLIEGERGKLHVTSDDARTENALMFGIGRKVFNMDNSFEASMTDSNTVRITSGVFYDNGMFIRIDRDRYVEVSIENGLPGTFRHDLVCIRYERNIQTQLESASIIVKKGEASETAAVDPEYTVGDVLNLEVHLDEFPLYRVSLNGITPTLEPMFIVEDMISNMVVYNELVAHLQDLDNPHQITSVEHAESADKLKTPVKINGVDFDGTEDVTLPKVEADSALSETSTNALQNKVITTALNGKMPMVDISETIDFDDITESGIYMVDVTGCYNAPPSGSAGVLIAKGDTYTKQIFMHLGSTTSDFYIYFRNKSGSSWGSWRTTDANYAKTASKANNISQSTAITETGMYALDAVQNNASVEGTLANRLTVVETNMSTYKTTLSVTAYLQSVQVNVVRRNNKTVDICLFALRTDGYDVPTGIPLATIPEGYRPNTTIFAAPAILINGISSGAIEPCCVNVTAEGEINNLLRYTTASGFNQIYFHISYIMD